MSYEDYKKMMIEDIKNDPEWWFDLIELKNKDIKGLKKYYFVKKC